MKYLIALILGATVGVFILVTVLIYNPFLAQRGVSPLSVSDSQLMSLNYSSVPSDAIVFTNNGESQWQPHPEKTLQLWEPSIRLSSAMATVLRDARGQTAGIGIKFSSSSERTRLLSGDVLFDSVWYLYLPDRGSLFVEQSENYWTFIREVVIPAYRSSANSWKGSWLGDLTAGPGALGTATVTAGIGPLQGIKMQGVESLSAKAYSVESGPIAAEGRLLIEMLGADENPDDVAIAE